MNFASTFLEGKIFDYKIKYFWEMSTKTRGLPGGGPAKGYWNHRCNKYAERSRSEAVIKIVQASEVLKTSGT
ncbi:MAG: hypothetical protein Ct9H300mP28_06200 [Pseudomonadota bacterium]|nr:MAG: hypothetical protein Ct9H300mP28_06200 [Pseudomonadota bacterium]